MLILVLVLYPQQLWIFIICISAVSLAPAFTRRTEHSAMSRAAATKSSRTINENDADWQRRLRHRREGVAAVKRSSDYRYASAVQDLRLLLSPRTGDEMPPTPDPHDRSTSKRSWEASMQRWKRQLRDLAADLTLPDDDAFRRCAVSRGECQLVE